MHFPVIGDLYHNMHIFNCRELCLIDELDVLKGFSAWRIEGQFYDIGSLKEIVSLYKTGREQVLFGAEYQKELLMEELKKYPNRGFTKGHFYRGVLE
jgi:putative protease